MSFKWLYSVICGKRIFICVGMRSRLIIQLKLLIFAKNKRLITGLMVVTSLQILLGNDNDVMGIYGLNNGQL